MLKGKMLYNAYAIQTVEPPFAPAVSLAVSRSKVSDARLTNHVFLPEHRKRPHRPRRTQPHRRRSLPHRLLRRPQLRTQRPRRIPRGNQHPCPCRCQAHQDR